MANSKIKLAIVGVGKIVKDQHLPSIMKSNDFELIATASRNGSVDGLPAYKDIESMLQREPDIEAVALCMPPQFRVKAAQYALKQRIDVLLEKPPGATVCEVEYLENLAAVNDCRLYTTWHSRHAAAVATAKAFLERGDIVLLSAEIQWKESVRKWHPGQDWIWQAGGLGVFDPGINGLSIMTHILPEKFYITQGDLFIPSNRDAPIAADLSFQTVSGAPITGAFDWRVTGNEQWCITVRTNQGILTLDQGGARLDIDGEIQVTPEHSEHGEYEAIYAKFARVIRQQESAVDLEPLKLVADAFLLGRHCTTDAFID